MQCLQWLLQHCADAGSIIESVVLSPTGSLEVTAAHKLVDSALDMEPCSDNICLVLSDVSFDKSDRPGQARGGLHGHALPISEGL